jgi:hypothetical protein
MSRSKMSPTRTAAQASIDATSSIQLVKKAAARRNRRTGRFGIYGYLEAVYSVYVGWKCRKNARRLARELANKLNIAQRRGVSPIRIIIDATLPDAHFKQKSRWVRALEHVYSENVSPSRFHNFVRARGGVAGCARLAVQSGRKRRRPGGDWNDDD